MDNLTNTTWKSSQGPIEISDMDTRHLYNTLKLVWNNSVKEEERIAPANMCTFDRRSHSREYMLQIIPPMVAELKRRTLPGWIKRGMYMMAETLHKKGTTAFLTE